MITQFILVEFNDNTCHKFVNVFVHNKLCIIHLLVSTVTYTHEQGGKSKM